MRKVLEKSENVETAETDFEVLLKSANKPNSFGRIFAEEEIGQAFVECMEIFNPTAPDIPDKGQKGKSKGKGKVYKKQSKQPETGHYRAPRSDVYVQKRVGKIQNLVQTNFRSIGTNLF